MGNVSCWGRVTHGIEWVAAAEATVGGCGQVRTEHRDVLFGCGDLQQARGFRCLDDLYALWSDFRGLTLDHTRGSLDVLEAAMGRLPVVPISVATARAVRVTVSMLGKRNYSRFEVEERLGPVIGARLGLRYAGTDSAESEHVAWCRVHVFDDVARVGLRVEAAPLHRREWRTEGLAGALHPPVAAAMALLAELGPGLEVVDPFAGSGTVLIEAALQCPEAKYRGRDIDPAAVHAAETQAYRACASVRMKVGDAANLPPASADRIVSNPPWGRAVKFSGGGPRRKLVDVLLAPLRPGGRAVVLADQELDLVRQLGPSRVLLSCPLRISGRLTDLLVVGSGPQFSGDDLGVALAHAWEHHRVLP